MLRILRAIINRILRRRPSPRPRPAPRPATATLDRLVSEAKAAGMAPSAYLEHLLMSKTKT
jgi:hypothetical protein